MTDLSINSNHASLDGARAKSALLQTKGDFSQLRQTLTQCFCDGSRAAAEAAAFFLLRTTTTTEHAVRLVDVLKTLSTAVPSTNADPLARIAAFVAISFSPSECREALQTFCFADIPVKRAATRAVLAHLVATASSHCPVPLLLSRTSTFFAALLADDDPLVRYDAVAGLARLPVLNSSIPRAEIAAFLLQLRDTGDAGEDGVVDVEFEAFLTAQIAQLIGGGDAMRKLLLRTLVTCFDSGSATSLDALWISHRSKVLQTVPHVGYDLFLYLLSTISASQACRGEIAPCGDALLLIAAVVKDMRSRSIPVHSIVAWTVVSFCTAIGSLSSAAGAEDVAQQASLIIGDVGELQKSDDHDISVIDVRLEQTSDEAEKWGCYGSVFSLSLLRRVFYLWKSPKALKLWMEQEFSDMVKMDIFSSISSIEGGTGMDTMLREDIAAEDEEFETEVEETRKKTTLPLCIASSLLALLRHPHSSIRLSAVDIMSQFRNPQTMLFCLPRIMTTLQEESNGAVAVRLLHELVVSASLISEKDTSVIAMSALLQLFRDAEEQKKMATFQTCLMAIAKAGVHAPGIATAVLQREAEKVRTEFGLKRNAEKMAIAAAILTLTRARPSRGTNFIPLISMFIMPENAETCPEAAALCMDAMHEMASHDVLDPVKAVKVVVKNVTDVMQVEPIARRSYLRLLGVAAAGAETKKGKILAEKIIAMLRKCIVQSVSGELDITSGQAPLSWDDVSQAADSLCEFACEDILRIAFCHDEPSIDLEAETKRLDAIQDDCANFTKSLLASCAKAHAQGDEAEIATKSLQRLLNQVGKYEWDNRIRSNFDPERVAKLRATADALRRARQAREGMGDGSVKEGDGVQKFLRSVEGTPNGTIRALCEAVAVMDVRALRAIVAADAISPALPWAELAEYGLRTGDATTRTACLAVLRCGYGEDFSMSEARARWFGEDSDKSFETDDERIEALLATVRHFPGRTSSILQDVTISDSFIISLLHAAIDIPGVERERISRACLNSMESVWDDWDVAARNTVIAAWSPLLDGATDENAGVRTAVRDGPPWGGRGILLAQLGEIAAVRSAVTKVVNSSTSGVVDDEALAAIARAVAAFRPAARSAAVCELADPPVSRTAAVLAARAVGTGALLPDVRRALVAGLAVCAPGERIALRRVAEKVAEMEVE